MVYRVTSQASRLRKHWILFPVLLIALIHGLTYVFIIPPWQHYDEPTHFEFAWLITNRESIPARNEFDQILRREIAASMLEHGFFESMEFKPTLIAQGEPVWIGSSQINHRYLYYFLIGSALHLVRGTDVVLQLYVGRIVSLGLYLLTILAAYGVTAEVTRTGNPLRWLVPLTIALIPSFVDLMTAVNDDVGATAIFSLFLWAGLRIILLNPNWIRVTAFIVLALACYWTKNTVAVAAVLAPISILFGFFRGQKRWFAWVFLTTGLILIMVAALAWGDAAYWYRVSYPEGAVRSTGSSIPVGKYAFHLPVAPDVTNPSITQVLLSSQIDQLKGKTVTLGAWIWASEPIQVRTPILYFDAEMMFSQVEVGEEPNYYSFSAKIPDDPKRLQVMLIPLRSRVDHEISIYYDGLVLVEGEMAGEPDFDGSRGTQLWIEQKPVMNHLRNASAESPWPFVHVWADELIKDFFPGKTSLMLAATLDWSPSLWYYQATVRQLLTSFWARFGWGHVTLIGFHPYTILGIFTAVGLIGGIISLGKRGHTLLWDVVIFFGASIATIWGAAVMRGIGSILSGPVFIPSARYAYPVIIPSMLLMTIGWNEILKYGGRFLTLSSKWLYGIYIFFFFGLIILSIFTIINFYYL